MFVFAHCFQLESSQDLPEIPPYSPKSRTEQRRRVKSMSDGVSIMTRDLSTSAQPQNQLFLLPGETQAEFSAEKQNGLGSKLTKVQYNLAVPYIIFS